MSWICIGIGAFVVMVYALLHSSLTAEQALIIIGLSIMSTCGMFIAITRFMTLRLQSLRGTLEQLASQSNARTAALEELKQQIKEGQQ